MLKTVVTAVNAAVLIATVSGSTYAQSSAPSTPGFEVLLPTGSINPTGHQQAELKRANLTAAQLSYGLRPDLVLTGTVGWARSRPLRFGTDVKLDLFTYDMGAEYRVPRRVADGRFNIKPFTGLGVGARTFNYRAVEVATAHNLTAYASVGAEVALVKIRLRLEVRDYVSWLSPTGGSETVRRNDVAFMAGIRLGVF